MYNYDSLLKYYKESIISKTQKDRKAYQAKLFLTTGFLLHLVQDMSVPAHTRDDIHISPSPFEFFARSTGGFNVYEDKINPTNNSAITAKIDSVNLEQYKYHSFDEFYTKSAEFTARNFFSKDSIFKSNYVPKEESVDKDYNNLLFEKENFYYTNKSLTNNNRIAISAMVLHEEADVEFPRKFIVYTDKTTDKRNDNVAIDNALNLMPQAVGTSVGLIEYIFRGKMEVNLDFTTDITKGIEIKNISNYNFSDGMISIYYEKNTTKERVLLSEPKRFYIPQNRSGKLNIFSDLKAKIPSSELEASDNKVTLFIVYDGEIGNDRGIAATKIEVELKQICLASTNIEYEVKEASFNSHKRDLTSDWLDTLIFGEENELMWTITGDNGKAPSDPEYRLTAKNNLTGEEIQNIYPFNQTAQGTTIYQLASGEWVMAQCGGEEILTKDDENWTDRKSDEYYKLTGTEDIIRGCSNTHNWHIIGNNAKDPLDYRYQQF